MGGILTSLDTGPIVYAKNMARVGQFTVFLKNIYIRVGGGQSAKDSDPPRKIIRVHINPSTVNSRKGVIVDCRSCFQEGLARSHRQSILSFVCEGDCRRLAKASDCLGSVSCLFWFQDPSIDNYNARIHGTSGPISSRGFADSNPRHELHGLLSHNKDVHQSFVLHRNSWRGAGFEHDAGTQCRVRLVSA